MHSLGMNAENKVTLLTEFLQKHSLNILHVYPQYGVFVWINVDIMNIQDGDR